MYNFGEDLYETDLVERTEIPVGEYNMKVKSIKTKDLDNDGKRVVIEVGCSILDGPLKGRMVSKGFFWEHPNTDTTKRIGREQLRSFIAKAGWVKKDEANQRELVMIENGQMHLLTPDFTPEEMVRKGATVRCRVGKNNKGYSEIVGWKRYTGEPVGTTEVDDLPF